MTLYADFLTTLTVFLLSSYPGILKKCVLANMCGAGELVFDFDHDHHPGTDPISDPQKSCEMELSVSFHGYRHI